MKGEQSELSFSMTSMADQTTHKQYDDINVLLSYVLIPGIELQGSPTVTLWKSQAHTP